MDDHIIDIVQRKNIDGEYLQGAITISSEAGFNSLVSQCLSEVNRRFDGIRNIEHGRVLTINGDVVRSLK